MKKEETGIITQIKEEILDHLCIDMMQMGFLRGLIETIAEENSYSEVMNFYALLSQILEMDNIEIGETWSNPDEKFVYFLAWKGSISEKISRLKERESKGDEIDKYYAAWLCLKSNVNKFEE